MSWNIIVSILILMIGYFIIDFLDNTKKIISKSNLIKITYNICTLDGCDKAYEIVGDKLFIKNKEITLSEEEIEIIYHYPKQIAIENGLYGYAINADGVESHITFQFMEHNTTYTLDTSMDMNNDFIVPNNLRPYLLYLNQVLEKKI